RISSLWDIRCWMPHRRIRKKTAGCGRTAASTDLSSAIRSKKRKSQRWIMSRGISGMSELRQRKKLCYGGSRWRNIFWNKRNPAACETICPFFVSNKYGDIDKQKGQGPEGGTMITAEQMEDTLAECRVFQRIEGELPE